MMHGAFRFVISVPAVVNCLLDMLMLSLYAIFYGFDLVFSIHCSNILRFGVDG